MIKRVVKHLRTNEAENHLQSLLENTEYYEKREQVAEIKN